MELVAEAELDRRLAEPSIPDPVGVSEIAEMLSVVRQRVTQLAQRSDFPPAVAHLKSGPVFVREQVVAFEKQWDRRGGRPAKRGDPTPVERNILAALSTGAGSPDEDPTWDLEGHLELRIFYLGVGPGGPRRSGPRFEPRGPLGR
ncbi:hypothetical protein OG349_04010 [Streptomyces sp. NBC_01317]|uniref:hypothetical protein n=1 Tax=Streptomyces sp. NBC_01317 TaxID=2903822 RepID=UPI002E11B01A|nr:hypothetical protein OG349_04010 [Streptomyces sp. NBC_01317]